MTHAYKDSADVTLIISVIAKRFKNGQVQLEGAAVQADPFTSYSRIRLQLQLPKLCLKDNSGASIVTFNRKNDAYLQHGEARTTRAGLYQLCTLHRQASCDETISRCNQINHKLSSWSQNRLQNVAGRDSRAPKWFTRRHYWHAHDSNSCSLE